MDHVYLNYSAFITLIAAIFTLLSGLFLLSIRKKSKATLHLAIALISISLTSFAFTFSFTTDHPAGAYHRWFTMTPVLVAMASLVQFFFYFPDRSHERVARWIYILQMIVLLVDGVVWVHATFQFRKVFQLDAMMWDVEESRLAAVNAAIILIYIGMIILAGLWRTFITRGKDRLSVLFIVVSFTVVLVLPGIANALARQGAMDKELFIITYALISVLGWFLTLIFYINFTVDKTSFMAKIVGLSLVTFLVMLMGMGYLTLKDQDKSFDLLHRRDAARIVRDRSYRPADVAYVITYSLENEGKRLIYENGRLDLDDRLVRDDLENTALAEKIATLNAVEFDRGLEALLRTSPPAFAGYKNALWNYWRAGGSRGGGDGKKALSAVLSLSKVVSYYRYRIMVLDKENFRKSLGDVLKLSSDAFSPFASAIQDHVRSSNSEGGVLKAEVLRLVMPLQRVDRRRVRETLDGKSHYISYIDYGSSAKNVYEVGFSYTRYRLFIHHSSIRMYYVLAVLLAVLLLVFPFFFFFALVKPLKRLILAHESVGKGNLDVELPVYVEDEIGYLSRTFNEMVISIKYAKQERDIAETELRIAEARFRSLVEQSLTGIYIIQDMKCVYVNPHFAEIFGYSQNEIIRLPSFLDLVFEDDRNLVVANIREREAGRVLSQRYSYRGKRKDGAVIFVEVHGTRMDMREKPAVVGTMLDITDRENARRALAEEKERLSVTLSSIGDGVIATDNDGRITLMNRVASELTEWPREDALWQRFDKVYTVLDRNSREEIVNPIKKCLVDGSIVISIEPRLLVSHNNREYLIFDSTAPIRDDDDNVIGAVIVFRDITESAAAQQEILHMRSFLKNIIDSMPSVLVGLDKSGRVIHWNQEAEKFTGISEKGARERVLADVFPLLQGQMDNVKKAISQREVQKTERFRCEVLGEARCFDVVVYPLIENGVEGAVVRLDDITARVRIEEMMIQTEKMMSVGGLAAGMAHEINNPLGGILLGAQNILRRIFADIEKNIQIARECGIELEKMREYLQKREVRSMLEGLVSMAERASRIVDNMLSFSRKSETRKMPTDMVDLVNRAVELASNDYDLKKRYDFRHIEIVREYQDDIPVVQCVGTEIQQVLLNLLKNAAQAMHERHYQDIKPRIILRLKREDHTVRIEVEDNGPGIPEEVKKRVFEPFFTTKEVGIGTGLGLSVSYFIVKENHGGDMEVESYPGIGANFIVHLPVDGSKGMS